MSHTGPSVTASSLFRGGAVAAPDRPDRIRWRHPLTVGDSEGVGQRPSGFDYTVSATGEVRIRHHGRVATTLRGQRAVDFLDDVWAGDDQLLMARLTGNYKRGNERVARNHPRNR